MSHAPRADKLLIKPAAGARPAPPRTRGQIIPKARTSGQSPDESHAARRQPGWRRPQTDQPAESYRHPSVSTPTESRHLRRRTIMPVVRGVFSRPVARARVALQGSCR